MSTPRDRNSPESPGKKEILFEDLARARREGACVSPGGTEGCQWDGFPEDPDDPDSPAGD